MVAKAHEYGMVAMDNKIPADDPNYQTGDHDGMAQGDRFERDGLPGMAGRNRAELSRSAGRGSALRRGALSSARR